jgi:hypothetical protein
VGVDYELVCQLKGRVSDQTVSVRLCRFQEINRRGPVIPVNKVGATSSVTRLMKHLGYGAITARRLMNVSHAVMRVPKIFVRQQRPCAFGRRLVEIVRMAFVKPTH